MENPIWTKPDLLYLFLHLLFKANWEDKRTIFNGQELVVKRGQLITGRYALAKELAIKPKVKPSTVWNWMKILQNLEIIDIDSNNQFSLITIAKYNDYQDRRKNVDRRMDNGLTTDGQRADTSKQIKQSKQYNSLATEVAGVNEIFDVFYKSVNPVIQYGNKTERKAAETLINKIGYDKAIKAAMYAVSIQGTQYSPMITKPTQLLNKYGELQAHYAKNIKNSDVAKI